jgi:hypothetical protein
MTISPQISDDERIAQNRVLRKAYPTSRGPSPCTSVPKKVCFSRQVAVFFLNGLI